MPSALVPGLQLCWAVGSGPHDTGARWPLLGLNAAPHVWHWCCTHSCAASDMKVFYQLWPRADSERLYPVRNIIFLAAAELSKFFSVIFFSPHWQQVNSCSSLILFKLRSNQNVAIKFIDHSAMQNLMGKKRLWQSLRYFSLTTSGWTNLNDLFKSNQYFISLGIILWHNWSEWLFQNLMIFFYLACFNAKSFCGKHQKVYLCVSVKQRITLPDIL